MSKLMPQLPSKTTTITSDVQSPITVETMRDWLGYDFENDTSQDAKIERCIKVATMTVEKHYCISFINKKYKVDYNNSYPILKQFYNPNMVITRFYYIDIDDNEIDIAEDDYYVTEDSGIYDIVVNIGSYDINRYRLEFTAGFSQVITEDTPEEYNPADDVPEDIKMALIYMTEKLFNASGDCPEPCGMPFDTKMLMSDYDKRDCWVS